MNATSGRSVRVAIGAGGTGGHIYPGLAVARALEELTGGRVAVEFHGARGRLEEQLVPRAGYPLLLTETRGLGTAPLPEVLARLAVATRRSVRRLRDGRVDVVVGMGGYPSLPVVLAARRCGVPLLVHESNAVPGLANRVASMLTRNVALAHPSARRRGGRVVGMPLLPELAGLDPAILRGPARRSFGLAPGQRLVVVCGGSLGAGRLTDAAIGLAGLWRGRDDVLVLVKTGPADLARAERLLAGSPVVRPVAYLDRMDHVYAAADVMVTRAGASTIAELAATGVPSILVPLPDAPGDHQRHNARVLASAGAARLVEDRLLDGPRLAAELDALLESPRRLARMRVAAAALGRTDAAETVARWALELAGATPAPSHAHPIAKEYR